jgi:ABC-2 type transport system ATP-binding protein
MTAIEIIGLKKVYPLVKRYRELLLHPFQRRGIDALRGIDLEIKLGECFCLMGPNGAGKSTLIKILATLVLPDEGQVRVHGMDIAGQSRKVKTIIGYALNDERSFYWRLTGRQNLDFFAAINGLSGTRKKERIQTVLKFTRLEEMADRRFNIYSTGMRQMLVFARALLTDPLVLLIDEPTRSLDPLAAKRVREFIRKDLVESEGKTVFWATHNLFEAETSAHRIAFIDHGRIKKLGKVSQLLSAEFDTLQKVYDSAVGKASSGADSNSGFIG